MYRVGHGVTDKFDDVPDADVATRTPRVFLAGDTCHTHTALATTHATGPLTGDDTHLHVATGYEPGRRFHSAEVIRLGDAKSVHLGHVREADGRWRFYAFADAVDPRNAASRLNTLMDFLAGPNSSVAKYTPKGWDTDSVFDVRAVVQQLHQELN